MIFLRQCSICISPALNEINSLLSAGDSIVSIARDYKLSEDALSRHKQRHAHDNKELEQDNAGSELCSDAEEQEGRVFVTMLRNVKPYGYGTGQRVSLPESQARSWALAGWCSPQPCERCYSLGHVPVDQLPCTRCLLVEYFEKGEAARREFLRLP